MALRRPTLAALSSPLSATGRVEPENRADPQGSEALTALVAWLASGGARCDALRIGRDEDDDGERGAFARASIATGDVVLEVPLARMITHERALTSDVGRAIGASGVDLGSTHAHLAAFLLQEQRDAGSPLRPYLESLPRSYGNVPVVFDEAELSLLEGSFTLPLIRRRKAAILAEYEGLRRAVRGFEELGFPEFLWARLAVATRVFSVVIDGRKTEALVPLADMLNHKRARETRWAYEEGAGTFVITALQGFAAGDPVRYTYGRKCNGRLFVSYGFAPDEAEGDEAAIAISIPAGDPLREEKLAALGQAEARTTFQVPASYRHAQVAAMLSFLRIACATGDELAQLVSAGGPITAAWGPVSVRNEEAALGALAAACEAALAAFPTSLEEDDARLGDPRLSANARRCVQVRRGEKRVLHHHLAIARAAAPLLRLPREQLGRAARDPPELAAYIADVAPFLAPPGGSDPPTLR